MTVPGSVPSTAGRMGTKRGLWISIGGLLFILVCVQGSVKQTQSDWDAVEQEYQDVDLDKIDIGQQQQVANEEDDNQNVGSADGPSGPSKVNFISGSPAPVFVAQNPAHNSRICSTFGYYHFKTFDGVIFHYKGHCNYVFASHCKTNFEEFNIQIRRVVTKNVPVISVIKIRIEGTDIEIGKKTLKVNGEEKETMNYNFGVTRISKTGTYVRVSSKAGIEMLWNEQDSIVLELSSKFANQTCGLCGDFNGSPTHNEFIMNDVKLTDQQYGNLHKHNGPEERCVEPEEEEPTEECTMNTKTCRNVLTGPAFQQCNSFFDPNDHIKLCEADACRCEGNSTGFCICNIFTEYSRQCAHAGGKPKAWRTSQLCPLSCNFNLKFHECGIPCQDTCTNPERAAVCDEHCIDGCFCPPGMVFDDINESGCVPQEKCPCKLNNVIYQSGEGYSEKCQDCQCASGKWNCVKKSCHGTCSFEGGSHVTTFDRYRYNFHGDCTYLLAKSSDSQPFSINAEIRICGKTETETCLKSITVSLNGGKEVILVKHCNTVYVNSMYSHLPMSSASFTVFRPTSHYMVIHTQQGMQVHIQMVPTMQVHILLDPKYMNKTSGMCANFNDIQADDLKSPSGVIEGTGTSFGNLWKTQADCPNVKNYMEDPCSHNSESEIFAKHWCEKIREDNGPFSQCHKTVDPEIAYQNCMYDACNYEKSEDHMCTAVSSYAYSCTKEEVTLRGWRPHICDKYTECPENSEYHYLVSTCEPSCRSLSERDPLCSVDRLAPMDGCICQVGYYRHENGNCVLPALCSCFYKGAPVTHDEVIHDNGAICTCTNGKMECIGKKEHEIECKYQMVYFDCKNATSETKGSECQKSCLTFDNECYSTQCVPGCMCPDGLVTDESGHCVREDECPCTLNDDMYEPGDTVQVQCNTCTCKKRKWECTTNTCLGTCVVYGEGHYLTFDNLRFRFNGQCEYTLVQDYCKENADGGTFRVISESVPCGSTGTTCTKAIKLFLGNMEMKLSNQKFDVVKRPYGKYVPFKVRQMGIYMTIEAANGLVLLWDRKSSIFMKLHPSFKGKTCGLCGNYDGNAANDLITRSSAMVGDVAEFGNSWKLSRSCPNALAAKDPCTANPYRRAWSQKQCSIITGPTFFSCHALVDPVKYYDACVSDTCGCDTGGDCECFCSAIAAYSQACSEAGECVKWRSPNLCPIFCDFYNREGQCEWHYHSCGAPCLKTCMNPTGVCMNNLTGLEGCYPKCPADRPYFDEETMHCVSSCHCYDEYGDEFKPGEKMPSEDRCSICRCTENGKECTKTPVCCHYNDKEFLPGDTVYFTGDDIGGCMTATCLNNGTIEKNIGLCPTTVAPTSTFDFNTASTEDLYTTTPGSSPGSTPGHPGETSTPKSSLPSSSSATSTEAKTTPAASPSACVEAYDCSWSEWYDVSNPDDGKGDFETFDNIRAKGHKVCKNPRNILCRAKEYPDENIENLKEDVTCSKNNGLICLNSKNAPICHNFEIKIECCNYKECTATSESPGSETTSPVSEKSTLTPTDSETPLSPGSSPPEDGHTTSQKPTSQSQVSSTPMPSGPSTQSTSAVTSAISPTKTCIPKKQCRWTDWYDENKPSVKSDGGEVESIKDLMKQENKACSKLEYLNNIECGSMGSEGFSTTNNQRITCDMESGLICNNRDQMKKEKCKNYGIKIECCSDVCEITPTTSSYSTKESATKPGEPSLPGTSTTVPGSPTQESGTTYFSETSTRPTGISSETHPTPSIVTQSTSSPSSVPSEILSTAATQESTTCKNTSICRWTRWYDLNRPNKKSDGGDNESLERVKAEGYEVCTHNETEHKIQCEAIDDYGKTINNNQQVLTCLLKSGLHCRNSEQKMKEKCHNYRIRVSCCSEYCEEVPVPSSTVTTQSTNTMSGSSEKPRTSTSLSTPTQKPSTGSATEPKTIPLSTEVTYSSEVPTKTTVGETSSPGEPGTSTSGTPGTSPEMSSPSEPGTSTTTQKPSTSAVTEPKATSTENCEDRRRSDCVWSQWINEDKPGSDINGQDKEHSDKLKVKGTEVCKDKVEKEIECQVAQYDQFSSKPSNQNYTCNLKDGLICENKNQADKQCKDYKMRILCCSEKFAEECGEVAPTTPSSTLVTKVPGTSAVSVPSTSKSETSTPSPSTTETSSSETPGTTTSKTPGTTTSKTPGTSTPKAPGSSPGKTSPSEPGTYSSEVPTKTTVGETSSPGEPGTSTSGTPGTSPEMSSPSEPGTSTTTQKPSTSAVTEPKATSTENCEDRRRSDCVWSQWINEDKPGSDINGQDKEHSDKLKVKGTEVCKDKVEKEIECQVAQYDQFSSKPSNQNYTCNLKDGLICENKNQADKQCKDYKMRILCCSEKFAQECGEVAPTTPSSTLVTKVPGTSAVSVPSTSKSETSTPSPSTTETSSSETPGTTTSKTPGTTTSKTPGTSTPKAPGSSPGKTSPSEPGTYSSEVPTKTTVGETSSPGEPGTSTSGTPGTSPEMSSPSEPGTSTTTQKPSTSAVTEPKATSTENCEDRRRSDCVWSQWINEDKPGSDINGQDKEHSDKLKVKGTEVCKDKVEKEIECQVAQYDQFSSKPSNQNYTCNLKDGLICENKNQADKQCKDYKMRILCCSEKFAQECGEVAPTTPSSTLVTKVPGTSAVSVPSTSKSETSTPSPSTTETSSSETPGTTTSKTPGTTTSKTPGTSTPKAPGSSPGKTSPSEPGTYSSEVPTKTTVGETSSPGEPGTSTSGTPGTSPEMSSPSEPGTSTTTQKPSTSAVTEPKATSTENCEDRRRSDCVWSQWINEDKPGSDINGQDKEHSDKLKVKGTEVCKDKVEKEIECQVAQYDQFSSKPSNQNYTCNLKDGLICENKNQADKQCKDYKMRILCCSEKFAEECGEVAPTTPSSTLVTKVPGTSAVSVPSTSKSETSTPSPSTTETSSSETPGTTTSKTPGTTTSKTPGTSTPKAPGSSPGKTSPSEPGTYSSEVPTKTTVGETSSPGEPGTSTSGTPGTSPEMSSPSEPGTSTTTQKPSTSAVTEPKATSTENCEDRRRSDCVWSQWINEDKPGSDINGQDKEHSDKLKVKGTEVCKDKVEKEIECQVAQYDQFSSKPSNQNYTCNLKDGLICENKNQADKQCKDYKMRILCCSEKFAQECGEVAPTTPSSTLVTKVPGTSAVSVPSTSKSETSTPSPSTTETSSSETPGTTTSKTPGTTTSKTPGTSTPKAPGSSPGKTSPSEPGTYSSEVPTKTTVGETSSPGEPGTSTSGTPGTSPEMSSPSEPGTSTTTQKPSTSAVTEPKATSTENCEDRRRSDCVWSQWINEDKPGSDINGQDKEHSDKLKVKGTEVCKDKVEKEIECQVAQYDQFSSKPSNQNYTCNLKDGLICENKNQADKQCKDYKMRILCCSEKFAEECGEVAPTTPSSTLVTKVPGTSAVSVPSTSKSETSTPSPSTTETSSSETPGTTTSKTPGTTTSKTPGTSTPKAPGSSPGKTSPSEPGTYSSEVPTKTTVGETSSPGEPGTSTSGTPGTSPEMSSPSEPGTSTTTQKPSTSAVTEPKATSTENCEDRRRSDCVWSQWINEDKPGSDINGQDKEHSDKLKVKGTEVCKDKVEKEIECQVAQYDQFSSKPSNQNYTCNLKDGLICENKNQADKQCKDYKMRILCCSEKFAQECGEVDPTTPSSTLVTKVPGTSAVSVPSTSKSETSTPSPSTTETSSSETPGTTTSKTPGTTTSKTPGTSTPKAPGSSPGKTSPSEPGTYSSEVPTKTTVGETSSPGEPGTSTSGTPGTSPEMSSPSEPGTSTTTQKPSTSAVTEPKATSTENCEDRRRSDCVWSQWINEDKPGSDINGQDKEHSDKLKVKGTEVCKDKVEKEIECQVAQYDQFSSKPSNQNYTCNLKDGLICENKNQADKQCKDYKMRILCCSEKFAQECGEVAPTTPSSTLVTKVPGTSAVSVPSTSKSETSTPSPSTTETSSSETPGTTTSKTPGTTTSKTPGTSTPKAPGSSPGKTSPSEPGTYSSEVPTKTTVGETSSPGEPGTSTSGTPGTSPEMSSPSEPGTSTTTQKPSTSAVTEPKATSTENCEDRRRSDCVWSQWINEDKPGSDINGQDKEHSDKLKVKGTEVCKDKVEKEIECQVAQYDQFSSKPSNQNYTCNLKDGLICENKNQADKQCKDYKMRILCCSEKFAQECGEVAPTTPSSTLVTKVPGTSAVSVPSTSKSETSTPSPSTTETSSSETPGTTTSKTPGTTTSKTPGTATPKAPGSSPGKTSPSEPGTYSSEVPTKTTVGETSSPGEPGTSTSGTPGTSPEMSSPSEPGTSTTTQKPSTSAVTEPKATSTENCEDRRRSDCVWSQWINEDKPGSDINGQDKEHSDKLKVKGTEVCKDKVEKEIECQVAQYDQFSSKPSNQNYTCNLKDGLICENKNQADKQCKDYKMRILCCSEKFAQECGEVAPTTPSSTLVTKVPGTSAVSVPSTSKSETSTPSPSTTETSSSETPGTTTSKTPGTTTSKTPGTSTPKAPGSSPGKTSPSEPGTYSSEVPTKTTVGETSSPGEPGTSTSGTPGTSTSKTPGTSPGAASPDVELTTSDTSETSSITPSSTSPASHTISPTTSETCAKFRESECELTGWFNEDSPSSDIHGEDIESLEKLRSKKIKVCKQGYVEIQIDCRLAEHPELSFEKPNQDSKCNLIDGSVCRNKDQKGNSTCFDSKIRFECCSEKFIRSCGKYTPSPLTSSGFPGESTATPIRTTTSVSSASQSTITVTSTSGTTLYPTSSSSDSSSSTSPTESPTIFSTKSTSSSEKSTPPTSPRHPSSTSSTTTCSCRVKEKDYSPGEQIYRTTDDDGCEYYTICNKTCEVEWNKGPCLGSTSSPSPGTSELTNDTSTSSSIHTPSSTPPSSSDSTKVQSTPTTASTPLLQTTDTSMVLSATKKTSTFTRRTKKPRPPGSTVPGDYSTDYSDETTPEMPYLTGTGPEGSSPTESKPGTTDKYPIISSPSSSTPEQTCGPCECLMPKCETGYRVVSNRPPGACCAEITCVPDSVCVVENTIYQPGSTIPQEKDVCQKCECSEQEKDEKSGLYAVKCEPIECKKTCDEGFAYVEKEGQCCGECMAKQCIVKGTDGKPVQFEIGKTYRPEGSTCRYYECDEEEGKPIVTKVKKICQELDVSKCEKDTLKNDEDGCCQTCTLKPEVIVEEKPVSSGNCSIRKNLKVLKEKGCELTVEMSYCGGPCMGTSAYSVEAQDMDHKCTCCRELETREQRVQLLCKGSKLRPYVFREPVNCGCVGAVCTPTTESAEQAQQSYQTAQQSSGP